MMRKILIIALALVMTMAISTFAQDQPAAQPDAQPAAAQPAAAQPAAQPAAAGTVERRGGIVADTSPAGREAVDSVDNTFTADPVDPRKTTVINGVFDRIIQGYLVSKARDGKLSPIEGWFIIRPVKEEDGSIEALNAPVRKKDGTTYTTRTIIGKNGYFRVRIKNGISVKIWFGAKKFKTSSPYLLNATDLWDNFQVVLTSLIRFKRVDFVGETCNECVQTPITNSRDSYPRPFYDRRLYFKYDMYKYTVLFKFGSAVIEDRFKPALENVAKKFKEMLANNEDQLLGDTYPAGRIGSANTARSEQTTSTVGDAYETVTVAGGAAASSAIDRDLYYVSLVVRGHADEIGDDNVNVMLSYKRAATVKAYLQKLLNLPASRIRLFVFSNSLPVRPCSAECDRIQNRRVDFHILRVPRCIALEEEAEDDVCGFLAD